MVDEIVIYDIDLFEFDNISFDVINDVFLFYGNVVILDELEC